MRSINLYIILFIFFPFFSNALQVKWKVDGLSQPESVVYHKDSDTLFVSNISGDPLESNGEGYISRIASNGQILEKKWIEGLDAPKGLTVYKNYLYVADINKIWRVSIKSRSIKKFIVPDAGFLNDLTVDNNGSVYASDMFKNIIFKLKHQEKNVEIWKESSLLFSPNGLLIEKDNLIIASWGKIKKGFETEIKGKLLKVNLHSKEISRFFSTKPIGNLDGIVFNGKGGYFATDWISGKLFSIDTRGIAKLVLSLNKGSADLEIIMHKKLLIIPMMLENNITAFQLD